MSADKADENLRQLLDRLGEDGTIEVLVYPAGHKVELLAFLTAKRDAGDLGFNVLELAGAIALRARRDIVNEVASRGDVARATINPTFTTNGSR